MVTLLAEFMFGGESMRKVRLAGLMVSLTATAILLFAQSGHLTTSEAKNHIGERATVCGNVASTHYAARSKGSPTFLNLDQPYPKEVFTILIWGSDRSKFGDPETRYANKTVCVTGLIKDYRGVPEIVAEQPTQIEVQK
jgi:DNA/RNA endonuclease YhcR with UshA esterase domain